jgi:hypothetical protein
VPLTFTNVLQAAGIEPKNVRLLRHQDARSDPGKTPYDLFRNDRPSFELYQSTQSIENRSRLKSDYWASFVGTPDRRTLFCGLYASRYVGIGDRDLPFPIVEGGISKAGQSDFYELTIQDALKEYIGVMFIDWGDGFKAWIQRNTDKKITELHREFKEPDFPGFAKFVKRLSELETLPSNWVAVLKNARGIYLLSCPATREVYIGKASGSDGFWGRWNEYVQNGHGGNVRLKNRTMSDYQVSILQHVGDVDENELDRLEELWKQKLQSREMGLNAN